MRLPTAAAGPRWLAAGAALGAAGIHAYVAPEHLHEWWLYGGFFIAVSAVQLALAWLVLRMPSAPVLLAGIWGTAGLIAIYVASRTTGLPLTPPGGHVHGLAVHKVVAGDFANGVPHLPGVDSRLEAVGAIDLAALAVELLLIVILVGLLPLTLRRLTTNIMLAFAVAAWGIGAGLAIA